MPRTTSYRHVLLLVAATACWVCRTVLSKQVLNRGVAPLMLLAIGLAASSVLLGLGTLVFGVRVTWSATLGRSPLATSGGRDCHQPTAQPHRRRTLSRAVIHRSAPVTQVWALLGRNGDGAF